MENLYSHGCHWVPWYARRMKEWNPNDGYQNCEQDHGRRGEIERALRKVLSSLSFGPVGGIEEAVLVVEELIERLGARSHA